MALTRQQQEALLNMPRSGQKQSNFLKTKSMKKLIGNLIKAGIFLFLAWFMYYCAMPTLSIKFDGIFWYTILVSILGVLVFMPWRYISDSYSYRDKESKYRWAGVTLFSITGIASFLIVVFVGLFGSTPLFRGTEPYRNMLGKINDTCSINNDISPIDPKHIVVMNDTFAQKLAEKVLPNSLGSRVELDKPTQCKIDTKDGKSGMYYVVSLAHTSYWKWSGNETVPGYILVNAENDVDVRMITEARGKQLNMKYIPSAYFGDNLERHIYMNGYANVGITDITLEADDELYPYYVVTTYKYTVGYSAKDATGVLVVDPVTGEIKPYSIKDCPKWIDRLQPVEFLVDQIDNWGGYVHGMWNWSGKDKLQPTEEHALVYGSDGFCYLYVGVTSTGTDEASAGFFLINTINKNSKYYKLKGATEYAAMHSAVSAVGKINPKLNRVTEPRPYNINGELTYVMAHSAGGDNIIRAISLVSYTNYQIASAGSTMQEALADYEKQLRGAGNNTLTTSKSKGLYDIKGVITRIYIDPNITRFMLEGVNNIFVVYNNISSENEVTLTKIGDDVHIKFENFSKSDVVVDYFQNISINVDTTLTSIDKYYQNFDSLRNDRYAKDYDARYKKLSEEEKYNAKGMKTNTSQNPDEVKLSKKEKAEKENAFKHK